MAGIVRGVPVLIVVAIGIGAPGTSAAQAPVPGDSSVDQYLPTIPSGGGNQEFGDRNPQGSGSDPGEPSSTGTETLLPPQVSGEIGTLDPAGDAVVEFTEKTAPSTTATENAGDGDANRNDNEGEGHETADQVPSATRSTPSIATVDAEGASGLGVALPIILAATLLVALLIALARRRGSNAAE
jgi:hypothetical protein